MIFFCSSNLPVPSGVEEIQEKDQPNLKPPTVKEIGKKKLNYSRKRKLLIEQDEARLDNRRNLMSKYLQPTY